MFEFIGTVALILGGYLAYNKFNKQGNNGCAFLMLAALIIIGIIAWSEESFGLFVFLLCILGGVSFIIALFK